ncbi:hypothetical protein E4U60_005119 [Claviceps pazoutovae]|uniref:Uncharacterized protein n=1 Tax=Claviceps pazoutovae TaxID=1649127 RepID=A0A9P7SJR3_9HYPO|nr:hypothetical protein E4U60_005119 [Claviceps pazoutovae]
MEVPKTAGGDLRGTVFKIVSSREWRRRTGKGFVTEMRVQNDTNGAEMAECHAKRVRGNGLGKCHLLVGFEP